LYSTIM